MQEGIFTNTIANMKWTDVQAYADNNAIVLLPLGVIEEHGPHLCLGTDIYTAHIYCMAVKEKLDKLGHTAVIAPPFYFGICQSTGGFIGSFNARRESVKVMLFDIVASLHAFGFKNIYGVNAHGDIEHSIAILDAFKEAVEQLNINARYTFDEWRLKHFGLTGDELYICPVKPQTITVSSAVIPDVHGGDIETAMIHHHYPHLVDVDKAKSLPPVVLPEDKTGDWLWGGHIKKLSPEGYLGSPAEFEHVDVEKNVEDYARRISEAIVAHNV